MQDNNITASFDYKQLLEQRYMDSGSLDKNVACANPDVNTQQLKNNVETNDTGSFTNGSVIAPIIDGKIKRQKNLRAPWKKGESGNRRGGNKGTIQLKPLLEKKLAKQKAEAFIDSIIEGAISGSDSKQERILKMSGQFKDESPQINIQNNTAIISDDMINAARQYLKDREAKNTINIKTYEKT